MIEIMRHVFVTVLALVVLAVSACSGLVETEPAGVPSSQAELTEPSNTTTAAADRSLLRAEAELKVATRLANYAPGSVTDEQTACVAFATVGALDDESLSDFVAAYAEPSNGVIPAGVVSAAERDRIVAAAVGCLPWTQTILESLQDLPDVPPAVVECAQEAAPSAETDRRVADVALFGGDLGTVLNLVLPPDCLPQTGASQADTAAGRLTAAQLIGVGVSPENAACVAEQVDALSEDPPDEQAVVAAMLGCLTPGEMALLSSAESP